MKYEILNTDKKINSFLKNFKGKTFSFDTELDSGLDRFKPILSMVSFSRKTPYVLPVNTTLKKLVPIDEALDVIQEVISNAKKVIAHNLLAYSFEPGNRY